MHNSDNTNDKINELKNKVDELNIKMYYLEKEIYALKNIQYKGKKDSCGRYPNDPLYGAYYEK